MKKYLLILLLCVSYTSFSQYKDYYRFAAGLRAGVKSGLTLKCFLTDNFALETILGYWHKSVDATLLAEHHFYPFENQSLSWYCGGGAHISGDAGNDNWKSEEHGVVYQDGQTAYGADIIGGIEFKFPVIPVAVSIDFKPFIEYSSRGGHVTALDAGIGIKCAF